MKRKIIFVTGLANGGKTTTLKQLIKKFNKDYLRANITINSINYHVRDGSNCDFSWDEYQKRVKKYSLNKNFIYPLCLELGYNHNTSDIQDILLFLKSLEETHELYFFVLVNGAQNKKIEQKYLDELRNSFSNLIVFDPSQADMSNQLLKYIQNIPRGSNEL
jgi:GTPase SAR1 family protein